MNKHTMKSGAEQVADMIESHIVRGLWTEQLPGVKSLACELDVNHKTVAKALEILEGRGRLAPAAGRRARRVLSGRQRVLSNESKSTKRLLILHPRIDDSEVNDYVPYQWIWQRLAGKAVVKGVAAVHHKKVRIFLDQLIALHAADALLMYNLPLAWTEAGLQRLPCYFAGGTLPKGREVSYFAHSTINTLKGIFETLGKLGHRQVFLPRQLFGMGIRERILSLTNAQEWDLNLPKVPDDFCVHVHGEDPATWMQMWKHQFLKLMPTAVVVTDICHLLSFYGFCQSRGIRIPEDVSVAVMDFSQDACWLTPAPAMCHFPRKEGTRHFEAWIKHGLKSVGSELVSLQLSLGGSLGPAREQ